MNPVLDDVDDVSALQSTSIENGVRDVAVNTGGRFGTIWELLKWFKKNTMRDILLKFHEFLEQNRTDWRLANKHYFYSIFASFLIAVWSCIYTQLRRVDKTENLTFCESEIREIHLDQ